MALPALIKPGHKTSIIEELFSPSVGRYNGVGYTTKVDINKK